MIPLGIRLTECGMEKPEISPPYPIIYCYRKAIETTHLIW